MIKIFFYCLILKRVRTSLTEKRNTAGLLDTVAGKNKRQNLPKYSNLKWYEEYRISQHLTATQSQWSMMTTANWIIKYLPYHQQLMRNCPNTLNRLWWRIMRFICSLIRASKCLCWLHFPYNSITVQVPNMELNKDHAKQCLLQPLYLLLSGFS